MNLGRAIHATFFRRQRDHVEDSFMLEHSNNLPRIREIIATMKSDIPQPIPPVHLSPDALAALAAIRTYCEAEYVSDGADPASETARRGWERYELALWAAVNASWEAAN